MTREEMRQKLQAFYDSQDNNQNPEQEPILNPEVKDIGESTSDMEKKPETIILKAEDDYER